MQRLCWILLLAGCNGGQSETATEAPRFGEGLFAEGCPRSGQSLARQIGVWSSLPGAVAVGTQGDFLLANERAAFVITEPDKASTYYYYGGILADAVSMDGCTPAEDRLDEVAFVLGQLTLPEITSSSLRGFRGTSVEVLADGSDGGPATVRVRGVDDTHWLVEYTLIAEAVSSGGRPVSDPLGVEVVLDYTLAPDSPILQMDLTVTNTGDEDITVLTASLLSFGETMDLHTYASDSLSVAGFGLELGLPWLLATDGEASLAYGVDKGNLAYERISGVDVAIDLLHALSDPFNLSPGQSDGVRAFLSVGDGDGPTATTPLAAVSPEPLPDKPYTLSWVSGRVVGPDGAPLSGVDVHLEARAPGGEWGILNVGVTDESGSFQLPLMRFEEAWEWRVSAHSEGRDSSETVVVSGDERDIRLSLSGRGVLAHQIADDLGMASPARLHLQRDDGLVLNRFLVGDGAAAVPPGTYTYTATRGYEYAPQSGTVEVSGAAEAPLVITLSQVVDTSGFLSIDTHVHTSNSPDSRMNPLDQLRHAAAHGLEVVLHTEHEAIVDISGMVEQAGLTPWLTNVNGQEVTASLPEHLTMFPVEPDGSVRGGFVEWYGADLGQIFSRMRARSGGGVNLINHPSYLNVIGWDRLAGQPRLQDATMLGLPADANVWSWDFDGIEVMNGHGSPFVNGNARFDNWQSLINAGHPNLAVGCSDAHGGGIVGFPRTYFASPTDTPAELAVDDLVSAFKGGQAVVSAGAFIRVSADTAGMGDLLTDTDGTVALDVHVEAIPEADVSHLIVFANCDQIMSVAADAPNAVVKFSERLQVPVSEDTNLVVAAFGKGRLPDGLPQYDPTRSPRAFTNPIYVDADGDGLFSAPGGRECSYDLSAPGD